MPAATGLTHDDALSELARFFGLSVELDADLTMFSEFIDDAWHRLAADEESFAEFSRRACGRVLGHVPSGSARPIVEIEWVGAYEARYGDIPRLWFADRDGVVDEDAYADYLATHTIVASWRCSPSSGSSSYKGDFPDEPDDRRS